MHAFSLPTVFVKLVVALVTALAPATPIDCDRTPAGASLPVRAPSGTNAGVEQTWAAEWDHVQ